MGVNGQRTLAHDRLDDGTRHTAVDEGARQAVAAANPGQFVGAPIRMDRQQWRARGKPPINQRLLPAPKGDDSREWRLRPHQSDQFEPVATAVFLLHIFPNPCL